MPGLNLSQRFFRPTWARFQIIMRYVTLRRQMSEVSKLIENLSLSDRRTLYAHIRRELDSLTPPTRDAESTNAAFVRVKASNARVRLIGLSQWAACTFRELEHTTYPELQDLHRQIMRMIRLLREVSTPTSRAA
jgi:hypothetical protein